MKKQPRQITIYLVSNAISITVANLVTLVDRDLCYPRVLYQ